MRWFLVGVMGLWASGCAHRPLSAGALDATHQVAFIARIADEAGPKSSVFRGDSAYHARLGRLSDDEADRRLALALAKGTQEDAKKKTKASYTMTRFEIADTLRAETLARLPQQEPWRSALNPVTVASALESFLVQEVPANAPDYERLRPYGVDTIIEIVVEEYGMRSEQGKAGVYLVGFARMFRLDGGEVYHRRFVSDELTFGMGALDPIKVARESAIFAQHLKPVLVGIADQIAKDLQPAESREQPAGRESTPGATPPPAGQPVQENDPL